MDELRLRGEVEVDGWGTDSRPCRYRTNRESLGATVFQKLIGDVEKLVPEQTALALPGANSGAGHGCDPAFGLTAVTTWVTRAHSSPPAS